ncbi:MAG: hypothetical protein V4543_07685 [Bacteroidota bacterium]
MKAIKLWVMLTLLFAVLGCSKSSAPAETSEQLPTIEEINILQKQNAAGEPIDDPETVFAEMTKYPTTVFGHNHIKLDHYQVFRNMIPKLRGNGILVLGIEEPTSTQPILDSIMSGKTSAEETTRLLKELNADFKQSDFNKKYDPNPAIIHPTIALVLDWLNSGGIVAAIDVPYIYDKTKKENIYQTKIMYQAIRNNSSALYESVKDVNINNLDDHRDLRVISEVRAAYMASVLNTYRLKGVKTIAFLGYMHGLEKVKCGKTVSPSVVQIARNYFNQEIFSLYPHQANGSHQFYKGHEWLGKYAYRASE